MSEVELVLACQAGDPRAFDIIVSRYRVALLSHATRALGDRAAAEDAVQEALLRAYRRIGSLDGDYRVSAWLHRILANVCNDEHRRRAREARLGERWSVWVAPAAPSPAEAIESRDEARHVARALGALRPTYREALILRDLRGLGYDDVAAVAGVTEDNARARVHRARGALRVLFEGMAPAPP